MVFKWLHLYFILADDTYSVFTLGTRVSTLLHLVIYYHNAVFNCVGVIYPTLYFVLQ